MSSIQNYLSDIAITALFGVGYYIFRNKKSKESITKENKITDDSSIAYAFSIFSSIEEFNNFISQSEPNTIKDPLKLLNLIIEKGLNPTLETYNSLLFYCHVSSDHQSCYNIIKNELFDPTSNILPDESTLITLIKSHNEQCFKEKERIDEEESDVSTNSKSNSSSTGLPYHHAYKKFSDSVDSLITEFQIRGVIITFITLNIVIESLISQHRYSEINNFFSKYKKSIIPNEETFCLLLKSIQSKGEQNKLNNKQELNKPLLIKGFSLLQEVNSKKLLSVNFFVSLMNLCVDFNDFPKAIDFLKTIKYNFSQYITEELYCSIIAGYSKNKNINGSIEIFTQLKNDLIRNKSKALPSISSYLSIINSLISNKLVEKAEEYFNEFEKENISKPELIECLYTTMILGYKQSKKVTKAEVLFEKIMSNNLYKNSVFIYNAMIDCYTENGVYNKAESLFNKMKPIDSSNQEDSLKSDLISYSLILKLQAKNNNLIKVKEIYNFLKNKVNYKMETTIYNTILDCYARNNDEENFNSILKDMKNSNISLNVVTYGIIIKLYVNLGIKEKVLQYFREINKPNRFQIKPSIVIYQLVLKNLIKLGDIQEAICQFNLMVSQNFVQPDALIYELIIKGCLESKEFSCLDNAYSLFELAVKNNIKIENFIIESLFNHISSNCIFSEMKKYTLIGNMVFLISASTNKITNQLAESINEYIVKVKKELKIINNSSNSPENKWKRNTIKEEEIVIFNRDYYEHAELRVDLLKVKSLNENNVIPIIVDNKAKTQNLTNNQSQRKESIISNNQKSILTKTKNTPAPYTNKIQPKMKLNQKMVSIYDM